MKRLILTALLALLAIVTPLAAQQAGNNIPVLPVVTPEEAPDNWWLLGDGYLQRQVEPTIAASTLNPDHLLAFFNDYRAIDAAEGDVGLGEGQVAAAKGAVLLAKLFLPPTISDTLPLGAFPKSLPVAASEAWIGGSRSYDGGLTWSGFFVPGASWDPDGLDPQVSIDTPIYGLEAATDPVLAPGPCGTFYLAFVAFTRGDQSKMVVARYRDTNDFEGGETFIYDGMTVVETGNNAEYGYFLDKPDIEVDVLRPADPNNQCGHRVYVTYSTFNGLTKDEKVQTKMNFASATVLGDEDPVFNSIKINKTFNQNQGSAIAVDPRPGTPGDTGGGTVYVFWRHFFDPDAIIVRKTVDYGVKWSNPEVLTTDMAPFDQPTIPAGLGREAITFRSNAFPTAAVTATGRVVAAWQERVDGNGSPDPTGTPRIVVMRSADGGGWEGLDDDGSRIAIDNAAERTEPFDPGLVTPATTPHSRPAGPQVMPKLSFGGGQLMLSFYESRGWIVPAKNGNSEYFDYGEIEIGPQELAGEFWMSGYDRVVDLRAALLNPEDGELAAPSIQVSRYPISGSADLAKPDPDGEELGRQDLADVAPINPPCSPDHDYLLEEGSDFKTQYPEISKFNPCVRQVNRINSPHSAVGTSAFAGDYTDLAPYVQFVYDTVLHQWRWAIEPGDVSTRGFHSVWTDNRHLIPPQNPDPTDTTFQEWAEFPSYGAPNSNAPSCINPGSRNSDVLTARINSGLVITAPTTYKQLDAERSFPFTVANQSNTNMFYEIKTAQDAAPYSKLNPVYDTVDAVRVMVFPYSSTSQLLTVQPESSGFAGPFKVEVRELVCSVEPDPDAADFREQVEACGTCDPRDYSDGTCQFGSVVFNAYGGNNPVGNLGAGEAESFGPTISNAFVINYNVDNAFVINETLDNAFVINGSPENAFVINNSPENAFVINAFVINAFVINQTIYDVVDVVWEMEPGTANTASSYLPLVNIDFAEQFLDPEDPNYAFQLIVDKPASYGTYGILENCNDGPVRAPQGQILSNVVQDPTEVDNAFVINKRPENAFVINETEQNAFVINAFVINSTFPMAPEDSGTKRLDTFTKEDSIDDSETKADPPSNKVRVTLRAYQLKESGAITGAGQPLFNPSTEEGGWVPSTAVAEVSCEGDCFTINGPNLIPSSTVTATPQDPLTAETCGVLEFDPGEFTVSNPNLRDGTKDAITRGDLQRHGFYLRDYDVEGNLILDRFLGDFETPKKLAVGASVSNPDAISLDIPSDVTEGDYTLVFFADWPLLVSEYDETDNTMMFPLTISAVEPPVALDYTDSTDQDVPLTASLADHIDNPNEYAPLEYAIVDGYGPSNGSVKLDEVTGAFTYTPNTGFVGTDSFDWTVSYCNETSDPATMTIEVLATCGWEFVGLKSPLNDVEYTAQPGSVVPLAWKYEEPIGIPVDSSNAGPVISFKGWPGISCSDPLSDPAPIEFARDEDPGSSDLRYSSDSWIFNWQSDYPQNWDGDVGVPGDPLPSGCYEITITLEDECVGTTDGPFNVYLK